MSKPRISIFSALVLAAGIVLGVSSGLSQAGTYSTIEENTSFDCDKAKMASEIAVCTDGNLAQMDKELASLYRSRLKVYKHDSNTTKKLHKTQLSWLIERNRCGSDVSCLSVSYQKRIAWLHEFEAYD